jgi:hypothetical protein
MSIDFALEIPLTPRSLSLIASVGAVSFCFHVSLVFRLAKIIISYFPFFVEPEGLYTLSYCYEKDGDLCPLEKNDVTRACCHI